MMRRPVTVLVFLLALVACGPGARQQSLRAMYTGGTAMQAGFVAWNGAELERIANTATSTEDGLAKIAAHETKTAPAVKAIETFWRSLAQVALVEAEPLTTAVGAFEKLRAAMRALGVP